jgi:hypothetical protein
MRAKAIGVATAVLAAGGLIGWCIGGCLPYITEPEAEPWAESSIPDHLAVVYSGEEADSSVHEYTFKVSVGGMIRFALSAMLTEGTAAALIKDKTDNTVMVDTRADPGMGPNVSRGDLVALGGARDYLVTVTTTGAKGTLSLNLDYVETPVGYVSRFAWNAQFPDAYPPVASRTETYRWSNSNTSATLVINASLPDPTQSVQFQVFDNGGTQVFSQTFTGIPATEQHTSPNPYTIAGGTAGSWRIVITHSNQGFDGNLSMTLQ